MRESLSLGYFIEKVHKSDGLIKLKLNFSDLEAREETSIGKRPRWKE